MAEHKREILRRGEAIAREIKLISDGGYEADYVIAEARARLIEALEEENPQTWEELQQCVLRRHLSKPTRNDGHVDLLTYICGDLHGPLPG